jgi:isopentenyl-diphosphate delta-isomerase
MKRSPKQANNKSKAEGLAMEQIILVDEQDREVGTGEKIQTHREGALHRAFSIFVFDLRGRLLLQKRARSKYHSGSLWSNTCCGHPRPGEQTEAAARRRLREEMNFTCDIRKAFDFIYKVEFSSDLYEHEYDHVFIGLFDGDPLPSESEVEEWKWIEPEELISDMRSRPESYTHWFKVAIERVLALFGSQIKPALPQA